MDKPWVVLLAGAPCWAFLLWVACWLIADRLKERRQARAAARFAEHYRHREHRRERDDRGQASAA